MTGTKAGTATRSKAPNQYLALTIATLIIIVLSSIGFIAVTTLTIGQLGSLILSLFIGFSVASAIAVCLKKKEKLLGTVIIYVIGCYFAFNWAHFTNDDGRLAWIYAPQSHGFT